MLSYHVERRLLECLVEEAGQLVAARVRSALRASSFDAALVLKGINVSAYEKIPFLVSIFTIFKSLRYRLLFSSDSHRPLSFFQDTMTSRVSTGTRPGARFAQFKLVLLGTLGSYLRWQLGCQSTDLFNRRVSGWKGDTAAPFFLHLGC